MRRQCAYRSPGLGAVLSCALLLTACRADGGQGTIELRGDIGGLDSIGARGDSLLERTRRPALLTDSGIVVLPSGGATPPAAAPPAAGASSASAPAAMPDPSRAATGRTAADQETGRDPAAEAITQRAMAKSESLARLDARGGAVGERGRGIGEGAGPDTLRGVLQVRIADGTREFLLTAQGRRYLLSGVALRGAMALNGLEVMVRGVSITPRDLAVSALVVRGWQSLPAVDGIVTADGTLRLVDGTGISSRPIPPALRSLVGARVWIAYRDGRPVQFDRMER